MTDLVILATDSPTTRYLINSISEDFDIGGIFIVESDGLLSIMRQAIKSIPRNPCKFLYNRFHTVTSLLWERYTPPQRRKLELYNEIFGNSAQELKGTNVRRLKRETLNTVEVAKEIRKLKPQIILLCSMPIVKAKIISSAERFCLNLHKGIIPYYRGTNCVLWPIYNGETDLIGVTIHQVNEKIDAGPIANQARYHIQPGDTIFSINLKLVKLGTELIKMTLKQIQEDMITWVEQDLSQGRVYSSQEATLSKRLKVHRQLRKMYSQEKADR